ncbi:MAG: SpoIIE family protein phosphatase, partial [Anaerohalosphaera sp.]|nr:SpoIIE family protein phosphatase [Anaerohalosphaera sp.]
GLSEEYRNKGPVSRQDTVIKAAFEGEAVVLDDMRVDGRVKYPEAAAKEGLISQLTVAMTFRNNHIGVLRLYSPKPKRFDKDSVTIARLIATQCAVAITNAKLYRRAIEGARIAEQMRLGAVVQRRMIPRQAPRIEGLDIAAVYQPCFDIGGDLYDFFKLNDHTITICIADVMGKGIPAAMTMSMLRGAISAYTDSKQDRINMALIIGKLNAIAMKECRDGEFITLFLAQIDVESMTMRYCNCGHEPGLLVRDGEFTELNTGGLVLGILDDAQYKIDKLQLRNNDRILLYTDGLIDAMDFDGELWGKDRMLKVLNQCTSCPSGQIVQNILGYRRRFVGLASQVDDTSLVAIRVAKGDDKPFNNQLIGNVCNDPLSNHD